MRFNPHQPGFIYNPQQDIIFYGAVLLPASIALTVAVMKRFEQLWLEKFLPNPENAFEFFRVRHNILATISNAEFAASQSTLCKAVGITGIVLASIVVAAGVAFLLFLNRKEKYFELKSNKKDTIEPENKIFPIFAVNIAMLIVGLGSGAAYSGYQLINLLNVEAYVNQALRPTLPPSLTKLSFSSQQVLEYHADIVKQDMNMALSVALVLAIAGVIAIIAYEAYQNTLQKL